MLCFARPLAPYAPPPRVCPPPQITLEEERALYGPGRAPADMLRIVQLSSNSVHCQSGNKDVEAQMRRWQELWCGEANRALSGVSSKVRELPLVFLVVLLSPTCSLVLCMTQRRTGHRTRGPGGVCDERSPSGPYNHNPSPTMGCF
jgi:hypothetical protein